MTEKRYIDVNALIAEYDRVHVGAPGGARKLMENAPTADVVEVVRCRDCIYYEANSCFNRQWDLESSTEIPSVCENDYCSYGEKKENTNEQKRNT